MSEPELSFEERLQRANDKLNETVRAADDPQARLLAFKQRVYAEAASHPGDAPAEVAQHHAELVKATDSLMRMSLRMTRTDVDNEFTWYYQQLQAGAAKRRRRFWGSVLLRTIAAVAVVVAAGVLVYLWPGREYIAVIATGVTGIVTGAAAVMTARMSLRSSHEARRQLASYHDVDVTLQESRRTRCSLWDRAYIQGDWMWQQKIPYSLAILYATNPWNAASETAKVAVSTESIEEGSPRAARIVVPVSSSSSERWIAPAGANKRGRSGGNVLRKPRGRRS